MIYCIIKLLLELCNIILQRGNRQIVYKWVLCFVDIIVEFIKYSRGGREVRVFCRIMWLMLVRVRVRGGSSNIWDRDCERT